MKYLALLGLYFILYSTCFSAESAKYAKDCAIIYDLKIDSSGAKTKVIISWAKDTSKIQGIYIKKKLKSEKNFPAEYYQTLDTNATIFIDENIKIGESYDYQIEKWKSKYSAWAYCNVGRDLPLRENNGKVLLVVDSTLEIPLSNELKEFGVNLIGAGYSFDLQFVPRAETFDTKKVESVKKMILDKYKKDSIRTVILIGRVPVPYSGDFANDGHANHEGAWPADLYYTDMKGVWTDYRITSKRSIYERQFNVPEDGKYDQSGVPGKIDLEIGRIDFYNLPAFKETELELLKRYFNKDKAFRFATNDFTDNAIIDDQLNMYSSEAFGSNGWINGNALFGESRIDTGRMRSILPVKKYKFTYGCNSGSMNSVMFIGYTDDYAVTPQNFIFGNYFGSWFGDYDEKDNFLRAAIACEPSSLTSAWNGRPFWYYLHFGLGESVGYSAKVTANNYGEYVSQGNYGWHAVNTVLMGDPTLKIRYIKPPTNPTLKIINDKGYVQINWDKSKEENLQNYYIYKADKIEDNFVRIGLVDAGTNSFIDSFPKLGEAVYQVKAMKKQYAFTGSYYDLSQGAFAYLSFFPKLDPNAFSIFTAPNPIVDKANIVVGASKEAECVIDLYDAFGAKAATLYSGKLQKGGNIISFNTAREYSSGAYYLTLKIGEIVKTYPFRIVK